jgi:Putative beta-barrel porin-2, OmpL-like. bbp2
MCRKFSLAGCLLTLLAAGSAHAADLSPAPAAQGTASAPASPPDLNTLGDSFFIRFINYYKLEWGLAGLPADPKAPPSRRPEIPPAPESAPPMPFTEWPYGGTTNLGANRPASVDSPLMVAIANTSVGKWMADNNLQLYGWLDGGGNISTNHIHGGNAPAAYSYRPNTLQLDQAILYFERTPDTVQKDSIDWGFRVSGLYGENYRYTTAFGLWSYQLLKKDHIYGYDAPMVYGEVFIPQVLEGLMIRVGRYISVPDIEAQLAPNNYMYSHSMTYTFDQYTNTGVQSTLAVTKNFYAQLGVNIGNDTMPWNWNKKLTNPDPNPLYPNATYLKDPGAKPSLTGCLRYQTDSANDNVYFCADAINSGTWGYNNLQWYGMTFYHKFNDQWHISVEIYNTHQDKVPNLNNPVAAAAIAAGGTPFSTGQNGLAFNTPNAAQCKNPLVDRCTASVQAFLAYLNYQFSPLDNLSFRGEFFNDEEGQRTGTRTRYVETGIGLQHWFSPQLELRPEVSYYRALDRAAFNGNADKAIAPNRKSSVIGEADLIWHF